MSVASRMRRHSNSSGNGNGNGSVSSARSTIASLSVSVPVSMASPSPKHRQTITPTASTANTIGAVSVASTPTNNNNNNSNNSNNSNNNTPTHSVSNKEKIKDQDNRESESKQEEVDCLAEHDFFLNLRRAHIEQVQQTKRLEDAQRRSAQREKALHWRADGKESFTQLQRRVLDLRYTLRPHQLFREAMGKIDSLREQTHTHSLSSPPQAHIARSPCERILALIRGESATLAKRFTIKANLIVWKMVLLRELRNRFHAKRELEKDKHLATRMRKNFWTSDFEGHPQELFVARRLFRLFMQYIPIPLELREALRKRRHKHRMAVEKMKRIKDALQGCANIAVCKSYQHYNPKGCSNCGVIFMGGSLEGAIPYVKSVSRDTGVPSLVTLEFELETLAQEEAIQIEVLKKESAELAQFEEEQVYSLVRTAIQRWWSVVLVFKRLRREMDRRVKSLFYYRVRRLSLLKREVDVHIREAAPIDMIYFCDKYCDFIPELVEYVQQQQMLKDERVQKVRRTFFSKLTVIVKEAREFRHREMLRLAAITKPPPPIKIKTLRPVSPKHLMCLREECNRRVFLSQERFDTHMKLHRQQDFVRYAKYAEHERRREEKVVVEKALITNIQRSKEYISDYLQKKQSENNDLLENTEPATNQPEDRLVHCLPVSRGEEEENKSGSLPVSPMEWTTLPHRFNMFSLFNSVTFLLELVSKQSSVDAPSRVVLDNAVTRVGTHSSCELRVGLTREASKLGKIAKIHCLIYHGIATMGSGHDEEDDAEWLEKRNQALDTLTIVDNSSSFGVYFVGKDGARKVPSKITKGIVLRNGNLICVGVCKDGPPILPVVEASEACIVYRLQIK